MKERPIMFQAPMVRAIGEGRKTQTRRVLKPQPEGAVDRIVHAGGDLPEYVVVRNGRSDAFAINCPYGQPGDRLWVRETWRYYASLLRPEANFGVQYRADDAINYWPDWDKAMQAQCSPSAVWRPSLYMPRWASRYLLEITSVRVERVQDISVDDARAEGVKQGAFPIQRFQRLWDSINGKTFPWASNPWVWVLEFKKIEAQP